LENPVNQFYKPFNTAISLGILAICETFIEPVQPMLRTISCWCLAEAKTRSIVWLAPAALAEYHTATAQTAAAHDANAVE